MIWRKVTEKEPKKVSVSEDYLAFLHDELSENQARLRELLGESQSRAIFSFAADRLVNTVEAGKYDFSPIEGVARKLKEWGMSVSQKDKGAVTEVEIECPFAESVHPRMASKEPRCPLGEYVLGAVRLEDSKSQLLHNGLTEKGVKFVIKRA